MKNIIFMAVAVLTLFGCAAVPSEYIDDAKKEGIPVLITRIDVRMTNSGLSSPSVQITNTSTKAFKYLKYTAAAYNSVGDKVGLEADLEFTGPIYPGIATLAYSNSPMWSNSSIRCTEVTSVNITYMDGTTESFYGSEVHKLIRGRFVDKDNKFSCKSAMQKKIN